VETPAMLVNILGITDDAKCYEMVRYYARGQYSDVSR
jgi:hypothetical protein